MLRWFPFSTTYPQLVLLILTMAVSVTVLFGAVTSGVAFGSYNPDWDGTSELRVEADTVADETIIVSNTERYDTVEANGTVAFVIAPDEQYDLEDSSRIQSFVERGGTVVIADDQPERANPLLADLNSTVRIDGDPVRDEQNYYRSPALPTATETADHHLTNNVDELTLNHGTVLEPGDATVLVRTSEYAYVDRNRNEELDDDETLAAYPVATVEERGDGAVVVLSDPSVLINAMIDRSDNREFVRTLVDRDRVMIDTSHGDEVPPLVSAVLFIRNSSILQWIIGLAAVTLVSVWSIGGLRPVSERISAVFTDSQQDDSTPLGLEPADIASVVAAEHPDWDESYRERITTAIINHRDDIVIDDGSRTGLRRDPNGNGERPDR